jgi:hypothetical protein
VPALKSTLGSAYAQLEAAANAPLQHSLLPLIAVRVLREVGALLVDVNGQHAALSLRDGATRVGCCHCLPRSDCSCCFLLESHRNSVLMGA